MELWRWPAARSLDVLICWSLQVIESSGRGERAYDIYSRLLKERIICVNGPIDDSTSNVIVAQLLYLESQHPEQKVCTLCSPAQCMVCGEAVFELVFEH